jgi:hypothetical protein
MSRSTTIYAGLNIVLRDDRSRLGIETHGPATVGLGARPRSTASSGDSLGVVNASVVPRRRSSHASERMTILVAPVSPTGSKKNGY